MKKQKQFIVLLASVLLFPTLYAQQFEVVSAGSDMSDLQASTSPRSDKKGNPCALLKISIPSIEGVTFGKDVVDAEYTTGEYLVYVPAKTKSIKVEHPNYLPTKIEFKEYGLQIESKVTYRLQLKRQDNVSQISPLNSKKAQYVTFTVAPTQAKVTINGETMSAKDGIITKLLPVGNYEFSVDETCYNSNKGHFDLTKDYVVNRTIELEPMLGWIEVSGDDKSRGADVFIDNVHIGSIPVKSGELMVGTHSVKTQKEDFKNYQDIAIVNEAETTNLKVEMERLVAMLSITAESGVEIWINDTLKSTGSWHGKLTLGDYHIEARCPHFKPRSYDITLFEPTQLVVDALEPIMGTLSVNFEEGVEVYLNEKYIGVSPLIQPCKHGVHKLTMRKEGYLDNVTSAIIKEDGTCSVWGRMIPQNDKLIQDIVEDEEREFRIINVVSLVPINDNPMKMFDDNISTSFDISPWVKESSCEYPVSDYYQLSSYDSINVFFGIDYMQPCLSRCEIRTGDQSSDKAFTQSSCPKLLLFREPNQTMINVSLDEEGYYDVNTIENRKGWQLLKLADFEGGEGGGYYNVSTTFVGVSFLSPNKENLKITDMKLYGYPTTKWGLYEPYFDQDFFNFEEYKKPSDYGNK